jgi:hypothetical protein
MKRRQSGASSLCSLTPEAASSLSHATAQIMAAVDFGYLQDALTRDAELRERVRDVVRQLEQAQRASLAVLARVHSCPDSQSEYLARDRQLSVCELALTTLPNLRAVPELVSSLEPTLSPLRSHLSDLAALIPPQQFYRYSDSFSRSIQQASFIIVFRVFLEREDVPSKEEVAQQLGSTLLSRSVHAPLYLLPL